MSIFHHRAKPLKVLRIRPNYRGFDNFSMFTRGAAVLPLTRETIVADAKRALLSNSQLRLYRQVFDDEIGPKISTNVFGTADNLDPPEFLRFNFPDSNVKR